VKGRQLKSHRHHERRDGVTAVFDIECKVLLDAAAHKRGITMAGYARRALAAFIAHDLGMSITEVTQYMSQPSGYREIGAHGRPLVRLNDDGEGYGDWTIYELGPNTEL
jgi:hypothetical protein